MDATPKNQRRRRFVARIERQRNPGATVQLALTPPDVAAAPSGLRFNELRWLALALKQRLRIAREAPDRAQRDVADNARDTELGIVDQAVGELLIARKVGADEASHIVDSAAHLPALDDLLDGGKPLLELALPRLLLQDDLGEDVDRLGEPGDIDQCLIADDGAGGFEPSHALEAGTRREPPRLPTASEWIAARSRCSAARILMSIRSSAGGRFTVMKTFSRANRP